jgi:hypothetical protein
MSFFIERPYSTASMPRKADPALLKAILGFSFSQSE